MAYIEENPYASPQEMTPAVRGDRQPGTFCALRPQFSRWDRFYKFYLADDALYGGWVGGQFFSKAIVRWTLYSWMIFVPLFWFVERIARWAEARRERLTARYDRLIEHREGFINADHRNLRLAKDEIEMLRFRHGGDFLRRPVPSTGRMWIQLKNQRRALFFFIDAPGELDEVIAELKSAGYPMQED